MPAGLSDHVYRPNSSFFYVQETILTLLDFVVPTEPAPPAPGVALKAHGRGRSDSENCARIRDLGFAASKHITMYGEHFELLSDPFIEGACTAVHAITQNDPEIRTLRLPVAILVGLTDRFRPPVTATGPETL